MKDISFVLNIPGMFMKRTLASYLDVQKYKSYTYTFTHCTRCEREYGQHMSTYPHLFHFHSLNEFQISSMKEFSKFIRSSFLQH